MTERESTVNPKNDKPVLIKCDSVQQAAEGGRMGFSVPQSTQDFFTDIRKPMIRSTPMGDLDLCPRKFLYAFRLGIRPRTYEGALTMGSIVHKILETLFMGQGEEEALETSQRLFQSEQTRLIDGVDRMGMVGGQPLEKVLRQLEEDYHKARAMAIVFWRTAPFDVSKYEVLRDPDGTPMVEVELDATYEGLSRPLRTPCDLALLERGTDDVWIVDYKTTGYSPKMRGTGTRYSGQLALYRLVLQGHLDSWSDAGLAPKRKVVGAIHALLQKPTIKYCPDSKDAEGFHHYIGRLLKWYETKDRDTPNDPPLALNPIRFQGPEMTRELWGRLKQFCRAAQATPNVDHFYRNDGACLMYNKVCPYAKLCNSAPAMWPGLIRDYYEIHFREDD